MKKLAILGASGHGKVVADLAELLAYECVFFDDAWPEKKQLEHWDIIGNTDSLLDTVNNFAGVVVAIGNNAIRREKQMALSAKGASFPALIHPNAIVSRYAQIGAGTVVFAGAIVNAYAQIGDGVILNTASTIDHDCVLQDFVHISPNASLAGGVKVEHNAWVGMGAVAKQLIKVGSNAIIGMGAVVTKDVPAGVTVVGNPAKPLVK